jgi:hypothetical protein
MGTGIAEKSGNADGVKAPTAGARGERMIRDLTRIGKTFQRNVDLNAW